MDLSLPFRGTGGIMTIYQVDAFADTLFNGNPAAVIPLEQWLEESLMQKIAMENNVSETVFFVKDTASANQYHIRWFTPEYEIDLCGHATLASAYIIKKFLEPHLNEIHFSTQKSGLLKTTVKGEVYTLDFPSRMPVACDRPSKLLKSLGIQYVKEVLKSRDYFVVLLNEQAVKNVTPNFNLMKELDTIGVIITAKGDDADVVSRCFYPGAGIQEDPVTGSAHCNIVPYWSEKLQKTKLHCLQLSARGGNLQCELIGDRVFMSGRCVLYMQGQLAIG